MLVRRVNSLIKWRAALLESKRGTAAHFGCARRQSFGYQAYVAVTVPA